MKNGYLFLSVLFLFAKTTIAQEAWKSAKFGYELEIPKGFGLKTAVTENTDFKVVDSIGSSIVITTTIFPDEYKEVTIRDVVTDELQYVQDFVKGGLEHFDNLICTKSGWSTISGIECFWMDYTEGSPTLIHKNYQVVVSGVFFSINMTCEHSKSGLYSAVWFRFKDNILFQKI